MDVMTLTAFQRDVLREVGGIGAGHAATALSQLVDHPVTLEVPQVDIVRIHDVPHMFGGPERLATAVHSRIIGDISGYIVFIAEQDASLAFVDLLRGRPTGTTVTQSADDAALLTHAASLLISSYLAAIARMADLYALPTSPAYACDMGGALLEAVFSEAEHHAEEAIMLRTALVNEMVAADVAVFFLPDPDSLATLLGRLGVA